MSTGPPRPARLGFIVAVALIAVAAPSPVAARKALPPQGIYEGCSPGSVLADCVERLRAIDRAGFRYVLNYSAWYGCPDEVQAYADAAAKLGLRLILPLNNQVWRGHGSLRSTYSTLAQGCLTATPPPRTRLDPRRRGPDLDRRSRREPRFIVRAIDLVANHPATWGFYIGDELPAGEVSRVRWLSATVRRLAPDKPQLYVARPGVARLRPFARFADVAGADPYPVCSDDPPVSRAARSARVAASAHGARTAMVLQVFSWSQYRPGHPPCYPDAAALRAMRDAAIRHARPAMILWYSYQDILRSDDPQRRWRGLVRAAFSPGPP